VAGALAVPSAAYYYGTQHDQTNRVVVLPEANYSLLKGAALLNVVLVHGGTRIALPLFEEAKGCNGDIRRCKVGISPGAGGQAAIERIANKLAGCAAPATTKFDIHVKGFASSSDFKGDKPEVRPTIVDAADERACVVQWMLTNRLQKVINSDQVHIVVDWRSAAAGPTRCGTYKYTNTYGPIVSLAPPLKSIINKADEDSLRKDLVLDTGEQSRGEVNGAAGKSFDPAIAQLNRRVDLTLPEQFGGCSSQSVVDELMGFRVPHRRRLRRSTPNSVRHNAGRRRDFAIVPMEL
jgi:hypothetical protein